MTYNEIQTKYADSPKHIKLRILQFYCPRKISGREIAKRLNVHESYVSLAFSGKRLDGKKAKIVSLVEDVLRKRYIAFEDTSYNEFKKKDEHKTQNIN